MAVTQAAEDSIVVWLHPILLASWK